MVQVEKERMFYDGPAGGKNAKPISDVDHAPLACACHPQRRSNCYTQSNPGHEYHPYRKSLTIWLVKSCCP